MHGIWELFVGINDVKFRCDDDFVDRLSRRYTVVVLMLFCIVVTTTTLVGTTIECWCPAQFTDTHADYANSICWIKNTYYVPITSEVDLPKQHEPKLFVNYYQWVPMILLVQALMCYFPSMLWHVLCRMSGMNVSAVMDAAKSSQRTTYVDIRDKAIRYMVLQIDRYLKTRLGTRKSCSHRLKHSCCLPCGEFNGNFLIMSYLLVKLFYLINAVGQLYILDLFMGINFHFFGVEVAMRTLRGEDWAFSERFPRETMCDFSIRHMNQVHRWVLQCVLPINLFNEKIFIFVWFWLMVVALGTGVSFCSWLIKTSLWSAQVLWVKRHLRPLRGTRAQQEIVTIFTESYLKRDGMFILRLINGNVGNLAASEVLCGLWDNYGPESRYAVDMVQCTNSKTASLPAQLTTAQPTVFIHRAQSVDSV